MFQEHASYSQCIAPIQLSNAAIESNITVHGLANSCWIALNCNQTFEQKPALNADGWNLG